MSPTLPQPIAFALIGCGGMGIRHARALAQMYKAGRCDLALSVVCDPDPAKRAKVSDLYFEASGQRPREYSDALEVFADPEITAVDLVLPTALHHSMILKALAAGKHVLVEKPLAMTVAACDLVVEAVRQTNLVVAVSENYRRIPANRAFKAMVADGTFGQIDSLFSRNFASAAPPLKPGQTAAASASPAWYHDRRQIGGFQLLEMGVHEVDLQEFWFGPIEEVSAELCHYRRTPARDENASEDLLRASFNFTDGFVSQIQLGIAMTGVEISERMLIAEQAVLTSGSWHVWQRGQLSREDGTTLTTEALTQAWLSSLSDEAREAVLPSGAWDPNAQSSEATDPLTYGVGLALTDFAFAIREGREPEINAETARRAVAVCCAMLEAAHSGQRVKVADVLSGKLYEGQAPLNAALGL